MSFMLVCVYECIVFISFFISLHADGQLQLAPHGLTSHTGLINEDEPQEEYQAIPDERDDDYAPVPADAIHDPRMSNAGAFHTGDTWTSGDGGTIDQPTSEFMFH